MCCVKNFTKMVILRLCMIIFVLFKLSIEGNAATHWIVTEEGMIQSHIVSPLDLRRPYDLIALLEQEKRWGEIQTVMEDLMSRKSVIEEKWTTLHGRGGVRLKMSEELNSDCGVDGKLLNNIGSYLNIATNGSERIKVELSVSSEKFSSVPTYQTPDCNKFSKVSFSTPDYEHFPSLHSDDNVTLSPEVSLEKIMPVESVQMFGHEIHKELVKNSSSWVHYNLGALYWRIQGNGSKALDCSRRAIHFVPFEYKDIPLHNLAGILYKAGRLQEAVLMLHAALEHAPKQPLHYLALGNAYLALGDFNNSVAYYDKFLELQPDHNNVAAIKKITMCFSKIENQIIDIRENLVGYLEGILSDLHDFHSLQQHWLRLSKRLTWEHSSFDELGTAQEDTIESMFGKKAQRCIQKTSDDSNKPIISCDFVDNSAAAFDTLNIQNLFQYVESETQRINERMGKTEKFNLIKNLKTAESTQHITTYPKFPTTMPTSNHLYFDSTGWPKEDDCNKWNLNLDEKDDLKIPVFLPPENKGYNVEKILSHSIGLEEGSEHPLPWYPPVCDDANGEKYVQTIDKQILNTDIKSHNFLQNHLLKYVNNGKADEAEIGQRIITAMEKKSAPNWVLATLASHYWRIRGNTRKALDCLDSALQTAPKDQTDVVLTSIASITHQLGLTNAALKYANLAFKLNYVEPSTNFLLSLLHYESNPLLAMYYMKNVLRVDADYYDGRAELLLKVWGCRIKLGYNPNKKLTEKTPEEMCLEKESFKGQGVICSPNGDECKTASIQCFHTKNLEGSGNLLEPDQSQLERVGDNNNNQPFHMRIFVGDEHTATAATPLGNFYVALSDDLVPESMLHVYDKSGTYPLSAQSCKEIVEADYLHFTSMWQSVAARNLDIAPLMKPVRASAIKEGTKPFCADASTNLVPTFLDHLTRTILRNKIPNSPDRSLAEWLGIMAGDNKASVEEIGSKLGVALQENTTSWLLATAAALYWRVVGNSEEAIICLRLALNYAPADMRDVPLISLANVLQRLGFHSDALEVAYMALKSHPNFVVNHFTVGNILTSMGDLEEAISFYRSSLALDSSFEPARNRLQAILCTLLFDESGSLRNSKELTDN